MAVKRVGMTAKAQKKRGGVTAKERSGKVDGRRIKRDKGGTG